MFIKNAIFIIFMIELIVIDWARTIYDTENERLFPDSVETLDYLKNKYKLAVVSLSRSEPVKAREKLIEDLGLDKYFELILIDPEDKNKLYEQAFAHFKLQPEEICIIDDRTVRGVQWGNKKGCETIWLQRGKFKDELPNEETGNPNYIIKTLNEVKQIL